jgi:hypothetical protein
MDYGDRKEVTAQETADLLKNASSVVITPGYGMAVAQAQYQVAELTRKLRDRNVDFRFGIRPVAGLPGHMNVLLAEAKVPYDIVLEWRKSTMTCPAPVSCSSLAPTAQLILQQPTTQAAHRRHARTSCMGSGRRRHFQALNGIRPRRCPESLVLPRELPDALR